MPKKTINEAIIEAIKRENKPLRVKDIFNRIIEDDLYRFNAADPEHIVRVQLRRHSENLSFPTAHKAKHFIFLSDGTYWLKGLSHSKISEEKQITAEQKLSIFDDIKALHKKYVGNFKEELLNQLIKLDLTNFEHFCKKLLAVYGFKNLKVTNKARDGGIDGHGELKIGLAYMNVAFECKRYSNALIGRPKISQFRGDIQGKFQQGIFLQLLNLQKKLKRLPFKQARCPLYYWMV